MTEKETQAMQQPEDDDEHLSDLPDGCGCAEVWEHLSEQRAADD